MTDQELVASLKSTYPVYKDMDDHDLISSLVQKFPQYAKSRENPVIGNVATALGSQIEPAINPQKAVESKLGQEVLRPREPFIGAGKAMEREFPEVLNSGNRGPLEMAGKVFSDIGRGLGSLTKGLGAADVLLMGAGPVEEGIKGMLGANLPGKSEALLKLAEREPLQALKAGLPVSKWSSIDSFAKEIAEKTAHMKPEEAQAVLHTRAKTLLDRVTGQLPEMENRPGFIGPGQENPETLRFIMPDGSEVHANNVHDSHGETQIRTGVPWNMEPKEIPESHKALRIGMSLNKEDPFLFLNAHDRPTAKQLEAFQMRADLLPEGTPIDITLHDGVDRQFKTVDKAIQYIKTYYNETSTKIEAALRDPETGRIYTGEKHANIAQDVTLNGDPKVARRLWKAIPEQEGNAGFVDSDGTFISRAEAQKKYGFSTYEELHEMQSNKGLLKKRPGFILGPMAKNWENAKIPIQKDPVTGQEFKELTDINTKVYLGLNKHFFDEDHPLSDILKTEKNKEHMLFKAYPELKKYHIRFNSAGYTYMDPSKKRIAIGLNTRGGLSQLQAKKELLHEVTHAVQYIEGWQAGGSPEDFLKAPESEAQRLYENLTGELHAESTSERHNLSQSALNKHPRTLPVIRSENHSLYTPKKEITGIDKGTDQKYVYALIDEEGNELDGLYDTLEDAKSDRDNFYPGTHVQKQESAPSFHKTSKSEEPFYSKLSETLNDTNTPKTMRGVDMLNLLRNRGVKPEELTWSGVEQFIKDNPKVTKQEVQKFIEENPFKINELTFPKEVLKKKKGFAIQLKDGTIVKYSKSNTKEEANKFLTGEYPDLKEWAQEVEQDLHGEPKTNVLENAKVVPLDIAEDFEKSLTVDTQYADKQIPGGKNYQEHLYQIPMESTDLTIKRELHQKWAERLDEGEIFEPKEMQEYENNLAVLSKVPNPWLKGGFNSSHWDEPNIVAHARVNDRTIGSDKVRFLEEVQSDWHKKGSKQGYIDITIGHTPADTAQAVPNAPFKKTWHEMVMRREIRRAVEDGKDGIAWTTGAQQNDRYNLAKHVSEIKWAKGADDNYHIWAFGVRGGDIPGYTSGIGIAKKDLANHIGKEPAQKIITSTEKSGSLHGKDLQVGGVGMPRFYDEVLPQYVNKFAKKWNTRIKEKYIYIKGEKWTLDDGTIEDNRLKEKVHFLKFTPQMKKEILEKGVPLFSGVGALALHEDKNND